MLSYQRFEVFSSVASAYWVVTAVADYILSCFFQLLIKKLCWNIVQGDIICFSFNNKHLVRIYEMIFVSAVGYFKEQGRQLCNFKIQELVAFIQCSRFKSPALSSVV